jgi:hypothetical protein
MKFGFAVLACLILFSAWSVGPAKAGASAGCSGVAASCSAPESASCSGMARAKLRDRKPVRTFFGSIRAKRAASCSGS